MPKEAIAPQRFDTSVFCEFQDFDQLRPEVRVLIATNDAELHALNRYSIVSGHFSLPSLLTIAPAHAIASVVREPRSRLLSVYAFWRVTDLSFWEPYVAHTHARKALHAFLNEAALAPMIDNQLCRLILFGDPRLPSSQFIHPNDVATVAADAIERTGELGLVGVHEMPGAMWSGLSAFFGVHLEPQVANVTNNTAEDSSVSADDLINARALELLELRTAADQIVYQHVVSRSSGEPKRPSSFAETAFARQLVRLGALLGRPTQPSN